MTYKKMLRTMDYVTAVLLAVFGVLGSLGAFEGGGIGAVQTIAQAGLSMFLIHLVWTKGLFRRMAAAGPRYTRQPVRPTLQATPSVHFTIVPGMAEVDTIGDGSPWPHHAA